MEYTQHGSSAGCISEDIYFETCELISSTCLGTGENKNLNTDG
jgi:hypothetical protein